MTKPTLANRIANKLAPHVRLSQRQEAYLDSAFSGFDEIRNKIQTGESADIFSITCVTRLLAHGRLADGTHPLSRLLIAVRDSLGPDSEWDELIAEVETIRPADDQRRAELNYIASLYNRDRSAKFSLDRADVYTPLGGEAAVARPTNTRMRRAPAVMKQEFELLQHNRGDELIEKQEPFEDATAKIREIKRAAVLGEPGAGKSTALQALARSLADDAVADPAKPVPLLIELGRWIDPAESLEAFIARESLPQTHVDSLLKQGQAALLLDGLNELPVDQRTSKYPQVKALAERCKTAYLDALFAVTCREADYPSELALDRILIRPLDPLRIRQFIQAYLPDEVINETLFWKLFGRDARREETDFKEVFVNKIEIWQRVFWHENNLPAGLNWPYWWGGKEKDNQRWLEWVAERDAPGTLLQLARNPYMLSMLIDVYLVNGDLPSNRGDVFRQFVEVLIERERAQGVLKSDEGAQLITGLQRLAFDMQTQRVQVSDGDQQKTTVQTTIANTAAGAFLNPRLLYLAHSCSLLDVREEVRFTHQLLQEFFAAREMQARVENKSLNPDDLWPPDRWWEGTNWEQATLLLAGLYSSNCTLVMDWLADAQPEVASRCARPDMSGATAPDATLLRMREKWLPRLTDTQREPMPEARAAVGRALGLLRLSNGELLDNRKGVGVINGLPDIDWVTIPAGEFIYGEVQDGNNWFDTQIKKITTRPRKITLPAFAIARYPVTYAQFQAFIDAEDGWANTTWWEGLNAPESHRKQPGEQRFEFWNHPRECVSWWDALAFCAWLSHRLDCAITLPTEQQWERAARFTDGRQYPWGNSYETGFANINERYRKAGEHYLEQTSAVGIYPAGQSVEGVCDLSGNVWEWCLNEYGNPKRIQRSGDELRVLRGGSWNLNQISARAAYRGRGIPIDRSYSIGFRLVRPC
jgi:formylglycine-generating enzyme required for sulfatase activity/energy-coupling factor transporter ATP-binding protein EcfA2